MAKSPRKTTGIKPRGAASSRKRSEQRRLSRAENRAARRAAIIAAAVRLFSTRAYDDVSIDDIAEEARVAHGLISYYFDGKRQLLAAALTYLSDEFLEFQSPRPDEVTPSDRIRGFLHRHFQYVRERPAQYRLLMSNSHADGALRIELDEARTAVLISALGCPPPPSPLVHASLKGWAGFLLRVTECWLNDTRLDLDEIVDLSIHVLVAASEIAAGQRFDDATVVAALERTSHTDLALLQAREKAS